MANKKHLKILKQGVKVWNKWREENPGAEPDLSEANLSGSNLRGANLSVTKLIKANLRRADLRGATLRMAILIEANLSGTKLSGADLYFANLRKANLANADLSGANLDNADLRGTDLRLAELFQAYLRSANLGKADLSDAGLMRAIFDSAKVAEANFESAFLCETVFANIDLSQALLLNNCRHLTSSAIDHRTLEKSENLPIEFLRGCGLPDSLIDWYQTLHTKGIEFYSCFISYSGKNQDFADRLYADLQNNGVRCWLATEDLKIGDPFRDVIDKAIRLRDKLLLILSKPALQSEWVKDEVEAAFEEERKKSGKQILFPIRIDDGIMRTRKAWAAKLRRQRHIGDFTNWKDHDEYQKAFDRLMRDLEAG